MFFANAPTVNLGTDHQEEHLIMQSTLTTLMHELQDTPAQTNASVWLSRAAAKSAQPQSYTTIGEVNTAVHMANAYHALPENIWDELQKWSHQVAQTLTHRGGEKQSCG